MIIQFLVTDRIRIPEGWLYRTILYKTTESRDHKRGGYVRQTKPVLMTTTIIADPETTIEIGTKELINRSIPELMESELIATKEIQQMIDDCNREGVDIPKQSVGIDFTKQTIEIYMKGRY